MVLKFILIGGVLPGAIATLLLLAGWFRTRRQADRRGPAWLLPLVLFLSIIPAQLLAQGTNLPLWPRNAADRMPHVFLAAALFGVALALAWKWRAVRFALPVIAIGVCQWMYVGFKYPSSWNASQAVLWMGVLVGGTLAIYALMEIAAQRYRVMETLPVREPDPALALSIFIAANAIPIVLKETGNAYLAQICGGVVACLGAALFVAIVVPRFSLARGGMLTIVVMLSVLMIAGYYHADRESERAARICMWLVAAGLAGSSLALAAPLRGAGMWRRVILGAVIAGVPTMAAVAIAMRHLAGSGAE